MERGAFEITKTLRFRLVATDSTMEKVQKKLGAVDSDSDFGTFAQHAHDFQNHVRELVFSWGQPWERLTFKLEIKYGWLRNYVKRDFYDSVVWKPEQKNKLPRKYDLSEIPYLAKHLQRWDSDWTEILTGIDKIVVSPLEKQLRRWYIAALISQMMQRDIFEFIREFINALSNTNEPILDKKITRLREMTKVMEKLLREQEIATLPSQSLGIQLTKGTFNYYTLNKTPKSLENDLTRLEDELKKPFSSMFRKDEAHELDDFFTLILAPKNLLSLNLDEAYETMKAWKAEQKSSFLEMTSRGKLDCTEYEPTEQEREMGMMPIRRYSDCFPIFNSQNESFESFLKHTKRLEVLANEKNDPKHSLTEKRKKEITEESLVLREKRGAYFNKPNCEIQTPNYNRFCDIYKRIALKRGQIIAKIKGVEKDYRESQQLEHWSILFEKNGEHSIIMVPRTADDNHKKAKEWIEGIPPVEGEYTAHLFKSLTLRALIKLCFKEGSTFAQDIKREWRSKWTDVKYPTYYQEWKTIGRNKMPNPNFEKEISAFFQKILSSDTARKQMDLVDFWGLNTVLTKRYEYLADFEIDLEKTCYVKIPKRLTEEMKSVFVKTFDAIEFAISSSDLDIEQRKKQGERTYDDNHRDCAHTKLWKQFWTTENSNLWYVIRLNPEVRIIFRERIKEIENNHAERKKNSPNTVGDFRNRYSKPHFILTTTITQNADRKIEKLAFSESEDLLRHINSFNSEISNTLKEFQDIYYHGIDRGTRELATLTIVRFDTETYEVDGIKHGKPEFVNIEAWKLSNSNFSETYKHNGEDHIRVAGKNPSYFINENGPRTDVFEKVFISGIDLTTAKMIKGHLVIDGDVPTLEKLKELAAKRKLFELLSRGKITNKGVLKQSRNTIRIEERDWTERTLYWFTENQKKRNQATACCDKVRKDLEDYLSALNKEDFYNDDVSVPKINHLRDAITANMVGVIAHLYNRYPGIIGLENLEVEMAEWGWTGRGLRASDKHFNLSNEDISKRLEWSLYRKFQTDGLVPSQLKQETFLRREMGISRVGIIQFVDANGTSSDCPRCWNRYEKTDGHYVCSMDNCGFSSKDCRMELEPLNNSDMVAAYNIAKTARLAFQMPPQTRREETLISNSGHSIHKSTRRNVWNAAQMTPPPPIKTETDEDDRPPLKENSPFANNPILKNIFPNQ